MLRTLWTGLSGMNANQEKLDAISNNISNVNTTGYKRIEVGFNELMKESIDRKGYPVNDKKATIGTGVRTGNWYRQNFQGSIQETSKPTDVAIDGLGYFKVILSNGEEAYTRVGAFKVDSDGSLVDDGGNKVFIEYKPPYSEENVKLTENNFIIDNNGGLFIKENDNIINVGSIPTFTAVGENSFKSIGDSLYQPIDGVEVFPTSDREIYQGNLEISNIDIGTEFAEMIVTQRAFELSSRGIKTADEMWGMVNSLRR